MATGSTQLTCFLTLAACVASVLVSLWLTSSRPPPPGEVRIFTAADLTADARLLLVVVGDVFDVSSGVEFYGPSGSYAGFTNASDASRAFLSADFEADATDDLRDLSPGQCLGIEHWATFYAEHETYVRVGIHAGRFFDGGGRPTAERRAFEACVARGHRRRADARRALLAAPPCARELATPGENGVSAHGVWHRFACAPPLVPRRARVLAADAADGAEPTLHCGCVALGAEANAVGDEVDDDQLPNRLPRCAEEASECTVRTK